MLDDDGIEEGHCLPDKTEACTYDGSVTVKATAEIRRSKREESKDCAHWHVKKINFKSIESEASHDKTAELQTVSPVTSAPYRCTHRRMCAIGNTKRDLE